MLKRVEDTIPEDRRAPAPFRTAPAQPLVNDILPAPDTWVNTAWIGFDYTAIPRLKLINKLKYEFYNHAQDDPRDIDGRQLQGVTNFFGLINKVEYNYAIGALELLPKLKSELLSQESFAKEDDDSPSLDRAGDAAGSSARFAAQRHHRRCRARAVRRQGDRRGRARRHGSGRGDGEISARPSSRCS